MPTIVRLLVRIMTFVVLGLLFIICAEDVLTLKIMAILLGGRWKTSLFTSVELVGVV